MKILDILNKLAWTTLLLLFFWEDLTWRNILIFGGIMIAACVVAYAFVRLLRKNEIPPREEADCKAPSDSMKEAPQTSDHDDRKDIDSHAASQESEVRYVKEVEGDRQETPHRTYRYLLAALFIGAIIAAFLNSRTFDAIRERRAMSFTYVAVGDFHAPGRYVSGGVVLPQETGHEKGMVLVNVLIDRQGNAGTCEVSAVGMGAGGIVRGDVQLYGKDEEICPGIIIQLTVETRRKLKLIGA